MASATARVAQNTIIQIIAKFVTLGLSMVTIAFIARFFEPELYGDYNLIMTLLAFATSIADFGINQIAVREIVRSPEQTAKIVSFVTKVRLLFSLGAASVLFGIVYLLPYSSQVKYGFGIALISIIFIAGQSGAQAVLQANLRLHISAIAEIASKVVTTIYILTLIWLSSNAYLELELTFFLLVASTIISALVFYLVIIWKTKWDSENNSGVPVNTRLFLISSMPLWIVSIFSLVHYKADTLMLSLMKGSYEVGVYGLAYRLLDVTMLLPGLLMVAVFPLISENLLKDRERTIRMMQKSFDFLGLLAIPMAVGIYFCAPGIIELFGGSEYRDSVTVLRILGFATIGVYLNAVFSPALIALNAQKKILYISVIGVTSNIILNLILIPKYSYYGSAAATLFSEIFGLILIAMLAFMIAKIRLKLGNIVKYILSSLIMGVTLWLLNSENLIVLVCVGGATYFAVAFMLKSVDTEIIKEILRSGRRVINAK